MNSIILRRQDASFRIRSINSMESTIDLMKNHHSISIIYKLELYVKLFFFTCEYDNQPLPPPLEYSSRQPKSHPNHNHLRPRLFHHPNFAAFVLSLLTSFVIYSLFLSLSLLALFSSNNINIIASSHILSMWCILCYQIERVEAEKTTFAVNFKSTAC